MLRNLLIFPLITQILVSLLVYVTDGFNEVGFQPWNLIFVFLFTAIPAFLFALVCYKQRLHQRNLVQIMVFSGTISFFYTLIAMSIMNSIYASNNLSLVEYSLSILLVAFAFALPSVMYAMLVLRLFLPRAPQPKT